MPQPAQSFCPTFACAAAELFTTLYDGAPGADLLTSELRDLYGGPLHIDANCVYANFVASIDGVVGVTGVPASSTLINRGSTADKFLMGVLRALSDVIVVGAGTFRAQPTALWTPRQISPAHGPLFRQLRESLDLSVEPALAIVAGRTPIDDTHPAHQRLPMVIHPEPGRLVDPQHVIEELRSRGHGRILFEAGPSLFGDFASRGLIDELFLTVAPRFWGEGGIEFDSPPHASGRAIGVRQSGGDLFLRYDLRSS